MAKSDGLKICSLNCQGLGNFKKRKDVFQYLRKSNCSIFCLQDTHFDKSLEKLVANEWGFRVYFSSHDSRSRGVAILFNNNFEFKIHKTITDCSGNFIIIEIEVLTKRFLLVNIYGPNKDNPNFYEKISNYVKELNNVNIIMVGDWNLLINPELDGYNYKHINNPKARMEVLFLINDLNLFDVWREQNEEEKRYTWRRKINNEEIQMGRLDFFLISESLINYSSNEEIKPGYRSDHSIIELVLNFNKFPVKKKTFWKFNNSLLYNSDFVKEIKKTFVSTKTQYAATPYNSEKIQEIENKDFQAIINPQLFLEIILLNTRSTSIAFSTSLKKKEDEKCKILENKIKELELLDPVKYFNEINLIKAELQEFRENKLKGSLIRSKARWIEKGEKPSRYFCNLENRNFVSKRMTSLLDKNNIELQNPVDIKKEVFSFYKKLYSSNEDSIVDVILEERLETDEIPKLSDFQSLSIEGPITYEEASFTLFNMQNMKSPGSTGFTTEFFKFFWGELGQFVIKSLNYGYDRRELSATQKEGIITCLPKPGKSRKYIKNWRPISLLNITYKIASGSIANRIKKLLPFIINNDQSGFMSGRFTGDNVRLIYDVLHYSNSVKKKGLMLLIDFEKAFDSVAWSFIEKCLNFFNFKHNIIAWIETFYKNIKSTVIVNNEPTQWFSIDRGCRKGDPISPYIFLICGEVLALMIRQNKNIKGYTILDQEIKVSQYADDTKLFLDGSFQSFKTCLETVLEYAKYSGLAMNFDKTKVIWFGCTNTPDEIYLPDYKFEWNPLKFTILGVEFTVGLKNITTINIDKKMGEMQHEINKWSKRDLTPFGKVIVIKSLVLSKIVHILMSLPSPDKKLIKKINNILYNFLWNGKPDKIKRKTARNKLEGAGISMIDLELFDKSLKLTWLRRFYIGNTKWKILITSIYPCISKIFNLGNIFSLNLSKEITNPFWSNILVYYYELHKNVNISCYSECYETSFLFNEKIKINREIISNPILCRSGIYFIKQLMENERFLEYDEFKDRNKCNINYLAYYSIIKAVKGFLQNEDIQDLGPKIEHQPAMNIIMKNKKGASNIYQTLIKQNCYNSDKAFKKWEERLGITIDEWIGSFIFLKITTKDTKLRWLQFRILHSILTTNRSVSKYDTSQNHLCTFCNKKSESILHLFWECCEVKKFWDELLMLINNRCKHVHNFKFDKCLIILGQSNFIYTDEVCNLIILMAKHFIYRSKVNGLKPSLKIFIKELFGRYQVEKIIFRKDINKLNGWQPYLELFKSIM